MINAAAWPGEVSHTMLAYRDSSGRAAAWRDYVRAGTAGGQAVLIVAPRQHLDGLDVQFEEKAGLIWLADLTSLGADPGRVLSMIRKFVRDRGRRPVRIVQDVGWLGRRDESLAEAIRYEALLCQALQGCAVEVLCGYDERCAAEALNAAERAHHVAGPDAGSFAEALSRPPRTASTFTFRADQAGARQFAADQARLAGLPPNRAADLVIAVGELAGNTLRHTGGQGTITIWTGPGELVCQVSDEGVITDPLAGTLRPGPASTGGHRGLWLVHQVSDLVQLRSGPPGTTVRVHLRLPGAADDVTQADSMGEADVRAVSDRH